MTGMSGAARQVLSSDGARVAVHDLGGGGPPVLLCHATGFHGLVWRPLARYLTDRFRCWALDFRGHGDSVLPPGFDPTTDPLSWEAFGDDVLAVVDDLGLEHAFGLGHSKGGAALFLAELARPGTFRALYAYEPIVMPVAPPPVALDEHPLAAGALRRREVWESRRAAYDNYASKPPLDSLAPDALEAYVEHGFAELTDGTVRLKCRGAVEAAVYRMGGAHRTFDRLGELDCPVTIAAGARDERPGPGPGPDLARLQAGAIPGARVEIFDHLGHFGPLEDPAAVARSAARFFTAAASA